MMVPFPRPSELTAASALLLLNATTPPPRVSVVDDELSWVREPSKRDESFVSCDDSNSCASSLRLLSKEEIRARQIRTVALHRDVKLKAAQKSESKIPKGVVKFNCRKTSYGVKVATTTSLASTSSESSCLTTSSTAAAAASRARRKHASNAVSWKKPATVAENQREQIPNKKKKKKQLGSNKIRRKAQAILELLSRGCYSEVAIRQALGDSPDTSKALRLLLRLEEVKRFGAGGRHSPFIYTIA